MLALAILMMAQTAVPGDGNPLAPALAGKIKCTLPDTARKTFRSLATYTPVSGGGYSCASTILIAAHGPIIIENTSPVFVRGRAVCGTISHQDFLGASLRLGSRRLTAAEAAPLLAKIDVAMTKVIGHEICQTYEATAGGLVEQASVDGQYQADRDQLIEWVDPQEGYSVAP
ncbi:MAG: hypothetical protein H7243_12085 [Sphingomonadaceae bacterium]|nr:hypothetical protein [Sphingomonadaceae bacterium]